MKRCLIADASEIIRKTARTFLEGAGMEVLEADTAQSALSLCQHKAPDVMLLDWHLPGMTTIEVLSTLRFSGANKRTTIVYFTTDNDPADINRVLAAGADTYFLKPFTRRDIVEKFTELGFAA